MTMLYLLINLSGQKMAILTLS